VRNIYGWSAYSLEESIIAATVPSKPLNAQTANSVDKVAITWDLPTSTGGSLVSLTAYKIEIQ
jgi:hypothetical protein